MLFSKKSSRRKLEELRGRDKKLILKEEGCLRRKRKNLDGNRFRYFKNALKNSLLENISNRLSNKTERR